MATATLNKAATRRAPNDGKGRPKGTKNKLPRQQAADARETFLPLLGTIKGMIKTHLEGHAKDPTNDCATCRHYVTLVCQYIFGKPTQRVQFDIEEVRAEARRLASEFDMDEDEVMAEAEAIVQGAT